MRRFTTTTYILFCGFINFSNFQKVFSQFTPTCLPEGECDFKPSCEPPEFSHNYIDWTSCTPSSDGFAYYGLTKGIYNYQEAVELCECAGGRLLVDGNSFIDTCVQHKLEYHDVQNEIILFSGRVVEESNQWRWCSENKEVNDTNCFGTLHPPAFNHWYDMSYGVGSCMGGYIDSNEGCGYGWAQLDCENTRLRAMCRLDCFANNSPSESGNCGTITTQETTPEPLDFQRGCLLTDYIPDCVTDRQSGCDHVPVCQPPENSHDDITWTSCNPVYDSFSYYGVSTGLYDFDEALELCLSYNAELVRVENRFIDYCVEETVSHHGISEEMILLSGRFNNDEGVWKWCPNEGSLDGYGVGKACFSNIGGEVGNEDGYQNWIPENLEFGSSLNGTCMGAIFNSTGGYGWVQTECSEISTNKVRAICRLDCVFGTTTTSTSQPTTTTTTTTLTPINTILWEDPVCVPNCTHKPVCSPPPWSHNFIQWNACEPTVDSYAWYGVTNELWDFTTASEMCACNGGRLVAVSNAHIDFCIRHTLDYHDITEQFVLFSGRRYNVTPHEDWTWCPYPFPLNESCFEEFGKFDNFVENWRGNEPRDFGGDCMGGYQIDVDDFGWVTAKCQKLSFQPVRAVCRLDCFHIDGEWPSYTGQCGEDVIVIDPEPTTAPIVLSTVTGYTLDTENPETEETTTSILETTTENPPTTKLQKKS